MAYLCPLCLKELTAQDRLEARCTKHPDVAQVFAGEMAAPGMCSVERCDNGLHLGSGDLLCRHVGCAFGRNPFWTGSAVAPQYHVVAPRGTTQEPVTHWEIHALSALSGVAVPEMWFPVKLLTPCDRGERRGRHMAVVSLFGAKNVGKTYLAMHALDAQGITTAVENFIYSYPPETNDPALASREFLQTLRLHEVMANNLSFTNYLASTSERPRNLKAVFFHALGPSSRSRLAPRARHKNFLVRRTAATWTRTRKAFRSLIRIVTGSGQVETLLLYDISGETAAATFNPLVDAHDAQADVMAVVISAEDLIQNPSPPAPDSLPAAARRLRTAAARKEVQRLRCALLVTKCDIWKQHTSGTLDRLNLRVALEQISTASGTEILEQIRRQTVDRVFFIHPDDPSAAAPWVVGLEDFAAWCCER